MQSQAPISTVIYLTVLAAILARVVVSLPRGRFSLAAIATQAAGMLLPVSTAALVGAASSISAQSPHPAPTRVIRLTLFLDHIFRCVLGASLHHLLSPSVGVVAADIAVVIINSMGNWITVALMFNAVHGEPVPAVWRRNFSPEWFFAFVSFGCSSLLIAHLVRGDQWSGLVYATLVVWLTISLRSHVSLAALRPFFSRSVAQLSEQSTYVDDLEGGIHDLRNLLMAAEAIADEQRLTGELSDTLRESVQLARQIIRRRDHALDQYTDIEMRDLLARASSVIQPIANQHRISVHVAYPDVGLRVYGDAMMLFEVLTNLLQNAVHASKPGGRVEVDVSRGRSGSIAVAVRDAGSGFPHGESIASAAYAMSRLSGHGIGLRWCETVARRHLGRITARSSKSGSVVTLILPDPRHARQRLAVFHRRASEESGTDREGPATG